MIVKAMTEIWGGMKDEDQAMFEDGSMAEKDGERLRWKVNGQDVFLATILECRWVSIERG